MLRHELSSRDRGRTRSDRAPQHARREGGRTDSPTQWCRRGSPSGLRSQRQSLEATWRALHEGGILSKERSDSSPQRRRCESHPGPRSRNRSLEAAPSNTSKETGQKRKDSPTRRSRRGSPSGPRSRSRSLEATSSPTHRRGSPSGPRSRIRSSEATSRRIGRERGKGGTTQVPVTEN